MVERPGKQEHTLEQVWTVIRGQGDQLHHTQNEVGKLQANFLNLADRVDVGFKAQADSIKDLATTIKSLNVKPDLKGWLALSLTILGTLGVIGLLVIRPMQENQALLRERQWELMKEVRYETGYREGAEQARDAMLRAMSP